MIIAAFIPDRPVVGQASSSACAPAP